MDTMKNPIKLKHMKHKAFMSGLMLAACASGQGLIDNHTGLQWLSPVATEWQSVVQTLYYTTNGYLKGWTVATASQVDQLFSDMGIPGNGNGLWGGVTPADSPQAWPFYKAMIALGTNYWNGPYPGITGSTINGATRGLTESWFNGSPYYGTEQNSWTSTVIAWPDGNWLVSIPEPTTLTLLFIGSLLVYRKTR
jgi:hypothetical protein